MRYFLTPQNLYSIVRIAPNLTILGLLWFLCKKRINLSPFTKDFRAEEQLDESKMIFQCSVIYLAELANNPKVRTSNKHFIITATQSFELMRCLCS